MTFEHTDAASGNGEGPAPAHGPEAAIPDLRTLADAYRRHGDAQPARRAEVARDVLRFLGIKPEWAAARLPTLRVFKPALDRMVAEAGRYGFSPQRARNIRSNVKAALAWALKARKRSRDILPEWSALVVGLTPVSDRIWLSGSASWLSDHGMRPDQVTDACTLAYSQDLEERGRRRVNSVVRATIRAWNTASTARPAWPKQTLTMPPSRRRGIPIEDFSPEFRADLADYIAKGLKAPAPSTQGQSKPKRFNIVTTAGRRAEKLRASTVKGYATQVRRSASLLARASGRPLTSVKSIAELVEVGAPAAILEELYTELGDCPTMRLLLAALKDVAQHHAVADMAAFHELSALLAQTPKIRTEMSERSRALLHALSVEDLRRLYLLSSELRTAVDRRLAKQGGAPTGRDVQEARVAVALSFLLYTPPRIHNLVRIRVDTNLHIPSKATQRGRLSFSSGGMKGKRPWSVPIRAETMEMVAWYRRCVLDRLEGGPSAGGGALFPGSRPGESLDEQSMRASLYEVVQQHVGRRIPPTSIATWSRT